jgi:hypothetical protein
MKDQAHFVSVMRALRDGNSRWVQIPNVTTCHATINRLVEKVRSEGVSGGSSASSTPLMSTRPFCHSPSQRTQLIKRPHRDQTGEARL